MQRVGVAECTSDRKERKRQEETRKLGEKCMGWKRKI